jgi:DNA-binding NtrC family response regulator
MDKEGGFVLAQKQKRRVILVLSPETEDCKTIERILSRSKWYEVLEASSCEGAKELMPRSSVIICEACLPGGNWQRILEMAQGEANQPLVIVCSKHADDRLWAEALNVGAHDVLIKPFDLEEVFRVVGSAVRQRSFQLSV